MKINFLLLIIITAAISSCSTSYKTGQTPDDVYYSPARLQTDNVRREDDNKNVQDNSVYTSPDDRYIRRRVHNRRYRRYDDGYNYPYGYNNGYNNYPPVYGNPKLGATQNTSQPRKTNLGAYKPNTTAPDSAKRFNPKLGSQNNTGTTNPVRTFGNPGNSSSNNGSAVGNLIRRVFSGDNSSNNSNNNYNNSNSNNSSSSRSFDRSSNNNNSTNKSNTDTKSSSTPNSTSAPVRTFKKDN